MTQTVLLLPGDGIGPEVIEQAQRVAMAVAPDLNFETALVGGAASDAEGEPLSVDTMVKAKRCSELGLGEKSFGFETSRYTAGEIRRVARVAFDIARGRRGEVASTEKSNVMESGLFWREIVSELHEAEGEGVALRHVLADACALDLVRERIQFDVILAGNLLKWSII